jgi:hypothetical protein
MDPQFCSLAGERKLRMMMMVRQRTMPTTEKIGLIKNMTLKEIITV